MKDYIKTILGDQLEIIRVIDYNDYLYVFNKFRLYSNPFNDERLSIISSQGPLKINKLTKDYEFTNIYEFLSEFSDNEIFFPPELEKIPTFDDIIKNIILRKHINWDDFDFLVDFYGISIEEIHMYSDNKKDVIEIDIKNEKGKNHIIDFLNLVEANYTIYNNHFEIYQNLQDK